MLKEFKFREEGNIAGGHPQTWPYLIQGSLSYKRRPLREWDYTGKGESQDQGHPTASPAHDVQILGAMIGKSPCNNGQTPCNECNKW